MVSREVRNAVAARRSRMIVAVGCMLLLSGIPVVAQDDAGADRGFISEIDIDISLYGSLSNPLFPGGDNNGNSQNLANPSAQDTYEIIIQHMADAIYEATDGLQRLGTVRFFQDGRRANEADIIWKPSGIPNNRAAGGAGIPGGAMVMFDVFPGGNPDGTNLNFRSTAEGRQIGGYLLAQRWLSHVLRIQNEFAELGGDIPVPNTLMNNPFAAAALNDPTGLNLSIDRNGQPPFQNFENTEMNSQHRAFGAAAWTAISRIYGDKKSPLLIAAVGRPIVDELLSGPQGVGGLPRIDLGGSTPAPGNLGVPSRAALNIVWDNAQRDIMICIDVSGSTFGLPLEIAKAAARLVVDKAILGNTSIGIVAFNETPSLVAALTPVNSENNRLFLRALINNLEAGGGTNIGGALQTAGGSLLSRPNSTRRVIHLLSDGFSNAGPDEIAIANLLVLFDINIISFAFGEEADVLTLQAIADITSGPFFQTSNEDLGDVVLAFDLGNAFTNDASNALIRETLLDDDPQLFEFEVGTRATRLDATAVFDTDPAGAIVIFRDPNGVEVLPFRQDVVTGGSTVQVFVVNAPTPGRWTVEALSRAGIVDFAFDANVIESGEPVVANLVSLNGTTVTYPSPVVLQAHLGAGLGVIGVDVSGTVLTPSNQLLSVPFLDDGRPPDLVAGDGTYSANFPYTLNGFHEFIVTFDNSDGKAMTTYKGTRRAPRNGGLLGAVATAQPANAPVPTRFERRATLDVNVVDNALDDHGDVPLASTVISADNTDVAGEISRPGDTDFFRFTPTTPEVVARLTDLGGGLNTRAIAIDILDTDGTTVLASGVIGSCGYLIAIAEVTPGLNYFVRVRGTGGQVLGTYNLSVGVVIFGDLEGNLGIVGGGGGGGGGGCFIATAAYGTPLEPRIDLLRDVRDRYLLSNPVGAAFSDTYYRMSPRIAETISKVSVARAMARRVVWLCVTVATYPLASFALVAFVGAFALGVRRVRRHSMLAR